MSDSGGFINARRLKTFIENAHWDNTQEWGERYSDFNLSPFRRNKDLADSTLANRPINDILTGHSCIADSLLLEPRRLERFKFAYLDGPDSRLRQFYGEENLSVGEKSLTPYVKSIGLGGGLCAQAVAFMATAAMTEYAKQVCGLAEITAYASDPNCVELSLAGLTPPKLQRFFARVGLNMTIQSPGLSPKGKLEMADRRRLSLAIKSYLQSGMPVILPTDQRKLWTTPTSTSSVYFNNGWRLTSARLSPDETYPHAILLIGHNPAGNTFVFHDPSALPYMVIDRDELAQIGSQRRFTTAVRTIDDNGVF
ncbi:MAG: hypothetical protein Q7U77_15230, partial [Sediminibacterium sp.]|uniref:hypothetical protein n=1 Tax=Sediminibacterium sp. TaxID=1917865 RepID=UPI00271DF359